MAKMEVKRDHEGRLHLFVEGDPVAGALVAGLKPIGNGEQAFEVYLPTKHVSLGEVSKVIPFRPAA